MRMCALSRCTRGCAHYPDAREDVRTIPMHARMCALSRCTQGCAHGGIRKNMFLEKCIDNLLKFYKVYIYIYISIGIHT